MRHARFSGIWGHNLGNSCGPESTNEEPRFRLVGASGWCALDLPKVSNQGILVKSCRDSKYRLRSIP